MNENDLSNLPRVPGVHKATHSRIKRGYQGASPSVAVKLASATGADAGVIYGLTQIRAIERAVDEDALDATSAADKYLRVLSTLTERFPDVESAEGGEELLDALEAALEESTSKSVEGVRGEKPAPTATKRAAPTFIDQQLRIAGKSAPGPGDIDQGDRIGTCMGAR